MRNRISVVLVAMATLAVFIGCNSIPDISEEKEANAAFVKYGFSPLPASGWVEVVPGGWKKDFSFGTGYHVTSLAGAQWHQSLLTNEIQDSSVQLKPALTEMLGRLKANSEASKTSKLSPQSGSCTANAVAYPYSSTSGAKAFATASCANLSNTAGAGATTNGYPL